MLWGQPGEQNWEDVRPRRQTKKQARAKIVLKQGPFLGTNHTT